MWSSERAARTGLYCILKCTQTRGQIWLNENKIERIERIGEQAMWSEPLKPSRYIQFSSHIRRTTWKPFIIFANGFHSFAWCIERNKSKRVLSSKYVHTEIRCTHGFGFFFRCFFLVRYFVSFKNAVIWNRHEHHLLFWIWCAVGKMVRLWNIPSALRPNRHLAPSAYTTHSTND